MWCCTIYNHSTQILIWCIIYHILYLKTGMLCDEKLVRGIVSERERNSILASQVMWSNMYQLLITSIKYPALYYSSWCWPSDNHIVIPWFPDIITLWQTISQHGGVIRGCHNCLQLWQDMTGNEKLYETMQTFVVVSLIDAVCSCSFHVETSILYST